jgi:hypothetical protein
MKTAFIEIFKLASQSGLNYQVKIAEIAKNVIQEIEKAENKIHFERVNSDVNGNPRFAVHFLQCKPSSYNSGNLINDYNNTCKLMNKIGGRKFNNKQFGGGIVFSSYCLPEIEKDINDLKLNEDLKV